MEPMATWEMVLVGIVVLLVLLWFRPGIRAGLRQSREAQERDWAGLMIPLLVVALLVILAIAMI